MTLWRDGWIDGRGYAKHPQRGEPQKYICLRCMGEFEPEAAVFEKHDCANFQESPSPQTVNATEAAIELAREHGVLLSEIEGSGEDGRVLKSDVEDEV